MAENNEVSPKNKSDLSSDEFIPVLYNGDKNQDFIMTRTKPDKNFFQRHKKLSVFWGVVLVFAVYIGFAYAIRPWTTTYPPDMTPGRFERVYRDVPSGERLAAVSDGLNQGFGWKTLPDAGVAFYSDLTDIGDVFKKTHFVVGDYILGAQNANLNEDEFNRFVEFMKNKGYTTSNPTFEKASEGKAGWCKNARVGFAMSPKYSATFQVSFIDTKNPNQNCSSFLKKLKNDKVRKYGLKSHYLFDKTQKSAIAAEDTNGVIVFADEVISATYPSPIEQFKDTVLLWK